MTTRFYVDAEGAYLGGFDGAAPPQGAVEVGAPPADGRQKWNGEEWSAPPATSKDVGAERARRTGLGYRHNFGGSAGIRTLDSRDDSDAINWLGLKNIADRLIADGQGETLLSVRDANDETFQSSAATISAALLSMAEWRGAILAAAWALKDQVKAGTFDGSRADIARDEYWPG
ncbi:hypothetical protein [Afifella sp. IM 167]|uniref:DUF4376 domain-containing protein n=1 Tax=Afifella sp. IM 167 TaxID=2033586 RepID=UPI001CCA9FA3|nr:hypothetical protein [Afifella sp. IM 167]MBZ8133213.1 hypothetical protein [Afifella sp. IM 167]